MILQWVKKQMWFFGRFSFYLGILAIWPIILTILILMKKFGKPVFGYIFIVYPGSLDQVRGYMPIWFRHVIPIISPIGVISKGKNKISGIVLTIPWLIEEIEEQNRLNRIIDKTLSTAEKIGARAIALAGRMPSVIALNNTRNRLKNPFVFGEKGAVYTILRSVIGSANAAGIDLKSAVIGIIGFGFIGSRLADSLYQEAGVKKIIAVDPRIRKERKNGVILTRDPAFLSDCDIIIALTARGEQIETVVDYFKKGVLVIDDTHPQIPQRLIRRIKELKRGTVVKAALGLDGVSFIPRLPKWQRDWIPGCCVEAITASVCGFAADQKKFNQAAARINFQPLIIDNMDDL